MIKRINTNDDSRTLLDFIKQEVIRYGIKNLVIDNGIPIRIRSYQTQKQGTGFTLEVLNE